MEFIWAIARVREFEFLGAIKILVQDKLPPPIDLLSFLANLRCALARVTREGLTGEGVWVRTRD